MPTGAYVEYFSTKPDGMTNPTQFSGDDQTNQQKLRDMVVCGRVPGFVHGKSQGTGPSLGRAQYIGWFNAGSTLGFRMNITWGGTNTLYPTSVQWEWSSDCTTLTNGTWVAMGSAAAMSFDANDVLTSTTNVGGVITMVLEMYMRLLRVIDNHATHAAGTGSAVHGLGSMSIQNTSFVSCSDGALNGTLGQTAPRIADVIRLRETFTDLGTIGAGATATLDLAAASHYACTAPGATSNFTVAMSNVPVSGRSHTFMFELVGGQRSTGVITWPTSWKWIGGTAPSQSALQSGTGRDIFSGTVRDGGTRIEMSYLGRGG